jgi:hypothetical protein
MDSLLIPFLAQPALRNSARIDASITARRHSMCHPVFKEASERRRERPQGATCGELLLRDSDGKAMNAYFLLLSVAAGAAGYVTVCCLEALLTGKVRFLFRKWRDPLVSSLCAKVEDGKLTQQDAYDILWDSIPLYAWVAVHNNYRDSRRVFAAAMRRSAYEAGMPDRIANRIVAGMLDHRGTATASDVERFARDAS